MPRYYNSNFIGQNYHMTILRYHMTGISTFDWIKRVVCKNAWEETLFY